MKTIIISLFFFLSIFDVNAQWTQINTGANDDYIQISFVNDSVGLLVSQNVLLLTKDYGNTWDTIYYNSGDIISDAQFINDTTIYFYGYSSPNAFLNRTYDLGNSWQTIISSTGFPMKLFFTSQDTGFILGDNVIKRTLDTGNTWLAINRNPPSYDFVAGNIFFTSLQTGYAAGWYNPVIYKTIDYGATWNLMANYSCLDVYFSSQSIGYICGWYGTIAKTTDGGTNWTTLISGTQSSLNAIFCPYNDKCYAVGDSGTILKTIDGGSTWLQVPSGVNSNFNSIFCTSQYCYAVGDSGIVLRTVNTLSINEIKKRGSKIKIYPNPTNENIKIEIANEINIKNISLYNISGSLIRKFSKSERLLNLKGISQGQYILKITTHKGVILKKIVKK